MSEALPGPTLGARFKSVRDHLAAFYQGLSNLLKTIFWILVFATLLASVLLVGFGFIRVDNVLIDVSRGEVKIGMKDSSAPPGPAVAPTEPARTDPAPATVKTQPPPPVATVKTEPPPPVASGPAPAPAVEKEYNVVLVFDRASVPEEEKRLFTQARSCAKEFVSSLDSRHPFSLMTPNAGNIAWAACDLNLATGRADAQQKIEYLWTAGRRATYDALAKALEHLQAPAAATRPSVVIVVTPAGADESQLPASEILKKLEPNSHTRSIKLHAIVYGPAGRNLDDDEVARTLREAAQATGGVFQAVGPDDLASAFGKLGKTGLAGR
jgi:hypothetical protein